MNLPEKICFVIYSFIVGAWCENAAGALLLLEIALILLMKFQQKRKIPLITILSFELTLAGFLLMVTAPAELKNKTGELNLGYLLAMVSDLFTKFQSFWLLWAMVGILLVMAICTKVKKEALLISVLIILMALAAGLCLIFGSYITERSLFFTVVLLVLACGILINALLDSFKIQILCIICLVCLAFPYYFFTGVNDINTCYYAFINNEQEIIACAEAGEDTAEISYVYPGTKYTASYGLQYLDQSDPESWPNDSMAVYYGVETVKAKN